MLAVRMSTTNVLTHLPVLVLSAPLILLLSVLLLRALVITPIKRVELGSKCGSYQVFEGFTLGF